MARAEAARDDGIDAVAIVTPNHLHAPVATAFLEAGIHVICDKPLAIVAGRGRGACEPRARDEPAVRADPYVHRLSDGAPGARARGVGRARRDAPGARRIRAGLAGRADRGRGNKQADWRNDPRAAGPARLHSATSARTRSTSPLSSPASSRSELPAELHTFVPGRRSTTTCRSMLRYPNGARGMLWASQVATGAENALRLRVFGTKAALAFDQEHPNELWFTPQGGTRAPDARTRGARAAHATRIPSGHPEGYLEAFAHCTGMRRADPAWMRASRSRTMPAAHDGG